jgi:hypothetical protein
MGADFGCVRRGAAVAPPADDDQAAVVEKAALNRSGADVSLVLDRFHVLNLDGWTKVKFKHVESDLRIQYFFVFFFIGVVDGRLAGPTQSKKKKK